MTDTWLRGWLPRVEKQNRKGLALALEPRTLFDEAVRPGGALVDFSSAASDPEILSLLRAAALPYVIDTSSWRFAHEQTWLSPKWSAQPFTPARPFEPTAEWVSAYVGADLRAQDALEPSAFVLPSWTITDESLAYDVAEWTVDAAKALLIREVALRPLIGQVRATRRHPEAAVHAVQGLGDSTVATFVSVENSKPRTEGVDRLRTTVGLLLSCAAPDRPVVGLRMAAIAPLLLSVGVAAVTSGPANGESFSAADSVRNSVPKPKPDPVPGQKEKPSGGAGVRIFVPEVEQTLGGRAFKAALASRSARAYLQCERPCHRYSKELVPNMAVADHHSVLSRAAVSSALCEAPVTMRSGLADRALAAAQTRLAGLNAALHKAGLERALPRDHLDHMRGLLASEAARASVA